MSVATQSHARPLLIVVNGPPAAGKSTVAELIARRVGCALLAKDAIKSVLLDRLGDGDRAWSRRLSTASFAVLFAMLPQWLDAARAVVIEGNFRAEHAVQLGAILERAGAGCVQVLCTADARVRASRLLSRASLGERHAGHLDADLVAEAQQEWGALAVPGPLHTLDTTSLSLSEAGAALESIIASFAPHPP